MARRAWQAQQDVIAETVEGQIAAVSEESLGQAVLSAVPILHRCGGCLSVVLVRVPTGFPNEMVTAHAIVEWKDRTDARPQPEQADPFGGGLPAATMTELEQRPVEDGGMRDADEQAIAQALEGTGEEIGDGLDNPGEDVDMSSVPEHLR